MSESEINLCAMCKQPESPERMGNFYNATSENGMRLIHFWVCNECANPLGIGQGEIDPEMGQGLD